MSSATRRRETVCPGCRSRLPYDTRATYDGYYHCSSACWAIYTEVLGFEFTDVVAFSQAHQLTVDTYAVQHAGGDHKAKSVSVHLVGLYAALELKRPPRSIPGLLQAVAAVHETWPAFEPPGYTGPLTVVEVALASSPLEHIERVRKWARFVWDAWRPHHAEVVHLTANVPAFAS
ncbi:MAG: DUF5946 family protein [Planctomycetota bacterium]